MSEKKYAHDMTREEFEALPYREGISDTSGFRFRSLIILPKHDEPLHESGYLCMDFIAVDDNDKPICRLAGGSDALHFDGIGGEGWLNLVNSTYDPTRLASGWTIDCLPTSGLIRIFPMYGKEICVGGPYSSFEIFAVDVKKED